MTNQEFIHRFETDVLPDDVFHHADHVRLAFAYLSECTALQALDRFADALKRYAAVRGKSQLYHGDDYLCLLLSDPRTHGPLGVHWME